VKKAVFFLVALGVVVVGLLVGTLNAEIVSVDLLWYQFQTPLGLAILLGFSAGVATALVLLYLARVLPLTLQLRKARSALQQQDTDKPPPTDE
jgi:uncharacterized integral membrane protein